MSSRWVVNASPMIVLARVNALHLLSALAAEVIVPRAVISEILAGPEEDPARRAMEQGMFIPASCPVSDEILTWDLGAGESAVLSFALSNLGWTAIVDDGAARRCARSLKIPHRGTIGIVVLAKQNGIINSASELIRAAINADLRIDEKMINRVLQEWSET